MGALRSPDQQDSLFENRRKKAATRFRVTAWF
jgi:hypothetical protein